MVEKHKKGDGGYSPAFCSFPYLKPLLVYCINLWNSLPSRKLLSCLFILLPDALLKAFLFLYHSSILSSSVSKLMNSKLLKLTCKAFQDQATSFILTSFPFIFQNRHGTVANVDWYSENIHYSIPFVFLPLGCFSA